MQKQGTKNVFRRYQNLMHVLKKYFKFSPNFKSQGFFSDLFSIFLYRVGDADIVRDLLEFVDVAMRSYTFTCWCWANLCEPNSSPMANAARPFSKVPSGDIRMSRVSSLSTTHHKQIEYKQGHPRNLLQWIFKFVGKGGQGISPPRPATRPGMNLQSCLCIYSDILPKVTVYSCTRQLYYVGNPLLSGRCTFVNYSRSARFTLCLVKFN